MDDRQPSQIPNASPGPGPQPTLLRWLRNLAVVVGMLLGEVAVYVLGVALFVGILFLTTSQVGRVVLALGGLVTCLLAIWALARKPYWRDPAPQRGRWLFAGLFFGPLVVLAVVLMVALVVAMF